MFVMRVVWGVCLAVAAMVTGIGMELHSTGASLLLSWTVVVAGVLMVPLCSAAIGRVIPVTTPE